jgi:hypothetical protein
MEEVHVRAGENVDLFGLDIVLKAYAASSLPSDYIINCCLLHLYIQDTTCTLIAEADEEAKGQAY